VTNHTSAQLFAEYISTVFIPYIEELRSLKKCNGTEAILLMGNCSVHTKLETLQRLTENQVKVVTFPLHATHIFQAHDLSLFGIFNKQMNYKLPFEDNETPAGFVKHIFHNLKQI
jgi:hypothetical protein